MRVNGTLYYARRDQLNSASEVLYASGAIVGEQRYYPFGETHVSTGSMFTDRLYTGQRAISGLGLDYYNARYYDPSLGRFISPDSITPGGPQGLNRYSYVMNNPIRYNDPTGHRNCEEDGYNCPGSSYNTPSGTSSGNSTTTTRSTTSVNNLKIKSQGEMLFTIYVMQASDLDDMDLETHAEEGYGYGAPEGEEPWVQIASDLMGTAEDFTPGKKDVFPIGVSLSWQKDNLGLLIKNLNIRNGSPTIVGVNGIVINNPTETIINGPNQSAYQGESITMNVNRYVSSSFTVKIEIAIESSGGFPNYPKPVLYIPVGSLPFPGCSVVNIHP
jgi:RHS repeat-associated protein